MPPRGRAATACTPAIVRLSGTAGGGPRARSRGDPPPVGSLGKKLFKLCAYLFCPPKERQAGPRPQWSSSFTCFTKQKTEGETNNQANEVLSFFFYPKHTNKSLTTLNKPNNPARKHKQQYPPTLPASAPCRRSDKVRPQKHALEQTPQRLKKLYSIFYKKK